MLPARVEFFGRLHPATIPRATGEAALLPSQFFCSFSTYRLDTYLPWRDVLILDLVLAEANLGEARWAEDPLGAISAC